MKTIEHENMQIEDFQPFYSYLHKQHPEIIGAEWDKEAKILKVFYQDGATELPEDELKNLKIPTILKFRKKVTPPSCTTARARLNSSTSTAKKFMIDSFIREPK